MRDPSSKLTRMRLDLEEFDFTVEYIKGIENTGADALSRLDFDQIKLLNPNYKINIMTRARAKNSITNDITKNINKDVYKNINNNFKGDTTTSTKETRNPKCLIIALTLKLITITDNSEKNKILKQYHDEPITGGQKVNRKNKTNILLEIYVKRHIKIRKILYNL